MKLTELIFQLTIDYCQLRKEIKVSQAILKNTEKLYIIIINERIFCSVGYTPGDALSALTLSADGAVKIEILEEQLFVSNKVRKNRTDKALDEDE